LPTCSATRWRSRGDGRRCTFRWRSGRSKSSRHVIRKASRSWAAGDFEGRGICTFEQDGPFVVIAYDWRLNAEKPFLRNLTFR